METGLERINIALIGTPKDWNDGATTGDYVNMTKYRRCLVVLAFGDGTAGSDAACTIYEAKDNAGTDAQVLAVCKTGRIHSKIGADAAAYLALTGWTEEAQAVASETWTPLTSGESIGLEVVEIRDHDLSAGFTHIRADLADPGQAKIGAGIYILMDPAYAAAPTSMPDPTA